MEPVKVIKNFISVEEANTLVDYIEKNHLSFSTNMDKLWFKKLFGLDISSKAGKSERTIHGLGDITDLSVRIVKDTKDALSKHFNDTDTIFLNCFWFVKHLPGDWVSPHLDTDDGENLQFFYSAVLYLNTVKDGGDLEFPTLNLSFKPEACDLIIFLSRGDEMLHEVSHIGENRYTIPMWLTKDKDFELKFAGDIEK
jgi:hypothetical protein